MAKETNHNWSQDLAIREIKLRRKTLQNIKDQLDLLFNSISDEIHELNVKLDRFEKEIK